MASLPSRKRKLGAPSKPQAPAQKKFKKQRAYHSDSSNATDEGGVKLPTASDAPKAIPKASLRASITKNPTAKSLAASDSESEAHSEAMEDASPPLSEEASDQQHDDDDDWNSSLSSPSSHPPQKPRQKPKRHDPTAFSSSMSAILRTSLSRPSRADPVLSRSKMAADASKALADSKLEAKARRKIREDKRTAKERGRVKDVLLGNRRDVTSMLGLEVGTKARSGMEGNVGAVVGIAASAVGGEVKGDGSDDVKGGMSAADIAAQERRLRKTAQRGVVKLFNAVRAAQVRGEEEARKVVKEGTVGMGKREERIGEMGRGAFLELVGASGGGGGGKKRR